MKNNLFIDYRDSQTPQQIRSPLHCYSLVSELQLIHFFRWFHVVIEH